MLDYLKKQGFHTIDEGFYKRIEDWLSWYQGKVKSFHSYTQYNGKKKVGRERATLGMAKKVCEDWANLLLNERMQIFIDNKEVMQRVNSILFENNFHLRANRLIELTYALGTGAFVEYPDKGNIVIDYIRADMIFPLSWENGSITEAAFASQKITGGKNCAYVNMHIRQNGQYTVINKLLENSGGSYKEAKLPKGIKPVVHTGRQKPLFQIITPNLVNNADLDNPMGISVFANAIDILKGIDLVYDSYNNEFRLGKKRIIVPVGMAQIQSSESGAVPIFDDNDTEFYAIHDKSLTDLREINMELRATAHEKALQKNLNLLSAKCGLGSVRYNYETRSLKTATEINTEKSELLQNIKKQQITLEKAISDMVYSIAYLCGFDDNFNLSISFDDSIIDDTSALSERALYELKEGVIDEAAYLMRVYKLTESQAVDEVKKMKARKRQYEGG